MRPTLKSVGSIICSSRICDASILRRTASGDAKRTLTLRIPAGVAPVAATSGRSCTWTLTLTRARQLRSAHVAVAPHLSGVHSRQSGSNRTSATLSRALRLTSLGASTSDCTQHGATSSSSATQQAHALTCMCSRNGIAHCQYARLVRPRLGPVRVAPRQGHSWNRHPAICGEPGHKTRAHRLQRPRPQGLATLPSLRECNKPEALRKL